MQLLVTFDSNENFLTVDVGLDMTLLDLMGLIEIEGDIPAEKQIVYFNAKQLSETDQPLRSFGFSEGDMILVRNKDAVAQVLARERELYAADNANSQSSYGEIDENGTRLYVIRVHLRRHG